MSFASSITETAFQLRMKMVGKTEEKINSFANKKQSSEPQPYYKMLYNIETVVLNDFIYYVVKPKTVAKTSKQTKAIIYIHGGSFIMELSYFHWDHIIFLSNKLKCVIYVPVYKLMKEKICNIEENMTFLIDLYKTVFESYQNISLFGDSAGGQLALSLAQQTKKLKLSPPKNIFLFSPLLSIQYDEHFDHYFELDKILSKELVFTIRSWFIKKFDETDPFVSPLLGDLKNIGKIFLFGGTNEIFIKYFFLLEERLRVEDIEYEFVLKRDMFHDFGIFTFLAESKQIHKIIFNQFKKN